MKKISINDILNFATEKSAREGIFKEGSLDTGLLLYAPGQTTPAHKHSDIDEVFYIVSGEGTVTIDGEEMHLKEKDIMLSPCGEMHGFHNTGDGNWVVLQLKIDTSK